MKKRMRRHTALFLLCLMFGLSGCAPQVDPELQEILDSMQVTDNSEDGGGNSGDDSAGQDGPMAGYPTLEGEEIMFVEKTFSDVFETIEAKGTGIYYIGFPDCDWCQSMVAILNRAAQESGQEIGYVGLYDEEKNQIYDQEDRTAFTEFAAEHLRKNDEGQPHLYSPYVFVLKDGEIAASHVGTLDSHNLEDGMTQEQEEELLQIYKDMLAQAV